MLRCVKVLRIAYQKDLGFPFYKTKSPFIITVQEKSYARTYWKVVRSFRVTFYYGGSVTPFLCFCVTEFPFVMNPMFCDVTYPLLFCVCFMTLPICLFCDVTLPEIPCETRV